MVSVAGWHGNRGMHGFMSPKFSWPDHGATLIPRTTTSAGWDKLEHWWVKLNTEGSAKGNLGLATAG